VKQIAIGLLALLFFGSAELQAASTVEQINAKVDKIDKLIEDKDRTLPSILHSAPRSCSTCGAWPLVIGLLCWTVDGGRY
jgi:hypothetical protein